MTAPQAQSAPIALIVFVAGSLFLFGLVELWLYRRFDYATMFLFRMFYYAWWHLAWGSLSLRQLRVAEPFSHGNIRVREIASGQVTEYDSFGV